MKGVAKSSSSKKNEPFFSEVNHGKTIILSEIPRISGLFPSAKSGRAARYGSENVFFEEDPCDLLPVDLFNEETEDTSLIPPQARLIEDGNPGIGDGNFSRGETKTSKFFSRFTTARKLNAVLQVSLSGCFTCAVDQQRNLPRASEFNER
jgi:hypothetical protein